MKDAGIGLRDDVQVDIGIALLQCGHNGSSSCGVAEAVGRDEVRDFRHREVFREF